MFWSEKVVADVKGFQTVNDAKSPSGKVHLGALRGVLIHDALYRTLQEHSIPCRYIFGIDDYDPLDELPRGYEDYYQEYLGVPLCNIPAPPGSDAPDIAIHYIHEFLEIFHELGVGAQVYFMRNIYRSGQMNEPMDQILRNAATIRHIYKEVSNSHRPDTWYPVQVICENCRRIGTTEVTGYDGHEVTYVCRRDFVRWAEGCGYSGKVSPFDGRGKLPYKLEWAAKWKIFQVTVEGAGKDHEVKGGSRDVAIRVVREVFGQGPPRDQPYEFFLVGGAKMSSSHGLGASSREMADFLPPDVLRFLMLRTPPNRAVNFTPDLENIVKLFNDYDRVHKLAHESTSLEQDRYIARLSQVTQLPALTHPYMVNFQLVLALVQMPHIDVMREVEQRKGTVLTEAERRDLNLRIHAARFWLDHYANEEERMVLQQDLPKRAFELSDTQRAFLHNLADALATVEWDEEVLQSKIFEAARLTPIEQPPAFHALYRILLDREFGPKAGSLLAFLNRRFVVERFHEIPYSVTAFWRNTSTSLALFESWLAEVLSHITQVRVTPRFAAIEDGEQTKHSVRDPLGISVVEFVVTPATGRAMMHRVLVMENMGVGRKSEALSMASQLIKHVAEQYPSLHLSVDELVRVQSHKAPSASTEVSK